MRGGVNPVVYFLKLENEQYYIGSTTDIDRRILEHQNGATPSTRHKRPVGLIFKQDFDDIKVARQVEYKLKRLKSRKIIEQITKDGKINLKLLGM